jgi:hypothetical protein
MSLSANPQGNSIWNKFKGLGQTLAQSKIGQGVLGAFETLGYLEGEKFKGNLARQTVSDFFLPDIIQGKTATKEQQKRAAQSISMANAATYRLESIADNIFGNKIGQFFSPSSYNPKTGELYNPYDEKEREERFGGFNLLTGTADLIAGSFVSPFFVFGKLGAVGRLKYLDTKVTPEKVVAKADVDKLARAEDVRSSYFATKNRLDELDLENTAITGRTLDDIEAERIELNRSLPRLEKQLDATKKDLDSITYADGVDEFLKQTTVLSGDQLIKHRVIKDSSNPEVLAGLLGENTDLYTAGLIYRSAIGDVNAQRLLAQESASTWFALNRARSGLGDLTLQINAAKQGKDIHELALLKENSRALGAEFKDLVKKDAYLARAVEVAESKVGYRGPSVFNAVEKVRADKAVLRGELSTSQNKVWDIEYFRRNPFVATVGVVSWPFRERPSGWVRTKGINSSDSVGEIQAFVGKVSAFTPEQRKSFINNWLSATDDISRQRIVNRLEQVAIRDTAKKYNISSKEADEIVKELEKRRSNAIKFYKEQTYLIDEEGRRIVAPQLSSQLADSMPIVDIVALDKQLKATQKIWKQADLATRGRIVSKMDALDQIWRPAVLMRLGYPQRNVGEGTLRAVAALGGLFSLHSPKDVGKATKNWYLNRNAGITNYVNMVKETELLKNTQGTKIRLAPLRTSWTKLVDTQSDYIQTNKNKIDNLQEELKDLSNDAIDSNRRLQINDEINARKENIKEGETKIAYYVEQANKKGVKGNRYRRNEAVFTYRDVKNLPQAFEDDFGKVLAGLAGTESRIARELSSPGRVFSSVDQARYRSAGFTKLEPNDNNYFVGLESVARQFRNAETPKQLLQGKTVDEVVDYLKNTPEGRKEFRLSRAQDPESYALQISYAVDRYFPDANLQKRVANEQITAADLKLALGQRKDLKSIHGDKIEEVPDKQFAEKYNSTVRKIFKYIGAMPEDTFVRHPFAGAVYKRTLKESIDLRISQNVPLTKTELNKIVANARRTSLAETRRTLYTIERYSNISSFVRFLEPFFAAQENTAKVWGKLVYNDPSLLARAGYIITSPNRAGLIQRDEQIDQDVVTMQIPNWMRNTPLGKALAGKETISFAKGAANLILQGEDWWRIGDGVFTQVLASEVAKQFPTPGVTQITNYFIPRGASREFGSYDIVLPTVAKQVRNAFKQEDARDFASDLIISTQIENNKYRNGLRAEPPTDQEIKERVKAFTLLRIASALTLPVSIKYRPELEFYINKSREYRTKFGPDAASRFYQDHPDYFEMFFSLSRNPTGINPNLDATNYAKKYPNLIAKITDPRNGFSPEFTQLITNRSGAPTTFDQNAYIWQLTNEYRTGKPYREMTPVDEIAAINALQRGWIEFTSFKNILDTKLSTRGLTSYSESGAEDLAQLKREFIADKRKSNFVWWKEYSEGAGSKRFASFLKAVDIVLDDKKFMAERGDEPVWDAFLEYKNARGQFISELQRRKKIGGSASLEAKSNARLKLTWEQAVTEIATLDPTGTFTTFYNRFLDSDTLEEID